MQPQEVARPLADEYPAGQMMNSQVPIRVYVVADVCLYREGLAQGLARFPRVRVLGTAARQEEVISDIQGASPDPDVLLLDMSVDWSVSLVRAMRELSPHTKIVALAIREIEHDVLACAEAGVAGYVPRDGSFDDLVATIEGAVKGELHCSAKIAASLFQRVAALTDERPPRRDSPLTPRELEVVELIDRGMSNKEISRTLHIEVSTVKNHIHRILNKLQVRKRGAAAARVRS